jgi:hypothetical protein
MLINELDKLVGKEVFVTHSETNGEYWTMTIAGILQYGPVAGYGKRYSVDTGNGFVTFALSHVKMTIDTTIIISRA